MVPNQVNQALPIWVQKPFLPLCRAPVSSTVIHAALVYVAGFVQEVLLAGDQQSNDLPLGNEDAKPSQQRDQSRDRDLSLMI